MSLRHIGLIIKLYIVPWTNRYSNEVTQNMNNCTITGTYLKDINFIFISVQPVLTLLFNQC